MIRPLGGQPLAGLSAALGLAALQTYFVYFSYYSLVMLFVNMVCLTVALPDRGVACRDEHGVGRLRLRRDSHVLSFAVSRIDGSTPTQQNR
jgi:hypothetical protein